MNNYIFDIDGTLTPSRQPMNADFRAWFVDWQKNHNSYLVTGSDYPKTLEQVGQEVIDNAKMVFNCCGNEVRENGKIIHSSNWKPSQTLLDALQEELDNSKFEIRTGNHIEIRTGLVNFSVIGRNATLEQRKKYVEYDNKNDERIHMSLVLERKFDDLDFMLGGETGLDIYPTGKDKRQVLDYIDKSKPCIFFGDKTLPGGNDYPLAISVDVAHRVENWEHTWEVLRLIA